MKELTVFFDGACVLCANEINHYRKKDTSEVIGFVDISKANFKAQDYGLDQTEVNIHLHGIDSEGSVYKGVDAFVEIWKRIPQYSFLISIFNNKFLRPVFNISYDVFAKYIRKYLPKNKCDDNSCSIKL